MALGLLQGRVLSILFPILWVLNGFRMGFFRLLLIFGIRKIASLFGLRPILGGPLLFAVVLEAALSHYWEKGSDSGRLLYTLAVGGGLFWRRTLPFPHLSLAVGSWLGVALWEIAEYHSVSLFTPLFSLISVPILCSFTYPTILFGIFFIPALYPLLSSLSTFTLSFLASFAFIPGNVWILPSVSLWIGLFLASLLTSFRMDLQKEWKIGVLMVICFIGGRTLTPMITQSLPASSFRAQAVHQLNVGQGDSAWISFRSRSETHQGLVDTGSFFSLTEEEWFLILARLHTRELRWVFLTHLDEDHAGGLIQLAKIVPIRQIFYSEKESLSPKRKAFRSFLKSLPAQKLSHSFSFPKLSLFPKNIKLFHQANAFMNGLVIPLTPSGSYINLGDANHRMETEYLKWLESLSLSRPIILKLSHHGSQHSSSRSFLKKLSPDQLWISCGYKNRYGHPHLELLERVKALNFKMERTDLKGDLIWTQGGEPSETP